MKKRKQRRHRWWVHAILEKRRQYGTYHHLVQELQLDGEMFQQYFRLSREQFSQVLFLIGDTLIKDNRIRDVISPRERLAVCLSPDYSMPPRHLCASSLVASTLTVPQISSSKSALLTSAAE
ncbi:hypothetical protein ACOMHN_027998 [Nucella lapillus]